MKDELFLERTPSCAEKICPSAISNYSKSANCWLASQLREKKGMLKIHTQENTCSTQKASHKKLFLLNLQETLRKRRFTHASMLSSMPQRLHADNATLKPIWMRHLLTWPQEKMFTIHLRKKDTPKLIWHNKMILLTLVKLPLSLKIIIIVQLIVVCSIYIILYSLLVKFFMYLDASIFVPLYSFCHLSCLSFFFLV